MSEPFFKKLTQLQKVIEFQRYHQYQRNFQVETIRRRFECAEDELVEDTEKQVKQIYKSVKLKDAGEMTSMTEEFNKKVDEMKRELTKARDAAITKVRRHARRLKSATDDWQYDINRAKKGIEESLQFLQNDSVFEPSKIAADLMEENASFEESVKAHDEESTRRHELLEKTTRGNEAEITRKYTRMLVDLRRKFRPSRAFLKQFIAGNKKMLTVVRALQGDAQYFAVMAKHINGNVFTTTRRQGKLLIDEMKRMKSDVDAVKEMFAEKTRDEDDRFDGMLIEVQTLEDSQKRRHEKEARALDDELKDLNPVDKLRRQRERQREETTKHIEELTAQVKLMTEYKEMKRKQTAEVDELESSMEVARQQRTSECINKTRVIRTVLTTANEVVELQKDIESAKDDDIESPVYAQTQKVLEAQETEVRNVLEAEFRKKEDRMKVEMADVKEALDAEVAAVIANRGEAVGEDYSEMEANFAKDLESREENHKAMYEELSQEFEKVEITVADDSPDEIEPLKVELLKLQNDIGEKREEIVSNYGKLVMAEEQRAAEAQKRVLENKDDQVAGTDEMTEKLAELDAEIARLELEAKRVMEATEKDVVRARKNNLKKINGAMNKSKEDTKALVAEIAKQSETYSAMMARERAEQDMAVDSYAARMDELKIDLQILHKRSDNEELGVKKDFMRRNTEVKNRGRAEFDLITADIAGVQAEIDDGKQRIDVDMKDDQMRYDALLLNIEGQQSATEMDLTTKITRLTKERNRVKARLENAGIRDQERFEIDNLESMLAQKCVELSQIGRELMGSSRPASRSSRPTDDAFPGGAPRPVSAQGSSLPKLRRDSEL